jgi:exodeoxyribonuclease-3
VKVATWNVNSLRARLPHVIEWLTREQPDLLALQETKIQNADFPLLELQALGYDALFNGQASYNGVAILTRHASSGPCVALEGFADEQKRVLAATFGGLRLWNVYVPNGQSVASDKYRYKLEWLAALGAQLASEVSSHPRLLVVGDFNIAPEDRDVYDPAAWQGQVLVSPPERAAFRALVQLGLHDLFRRFAQPDGSFSWWDYRAAYFRRNQGLRIDLMLGSEALATACTAVRIDVEPRRWERPSDHVPVVAEFADEV